ncbi:hypothetical protein M501DRAFT_1014532 [Patellaria atrata CBS 101060]|uniref:Uncharacterized protein n=1 Tax=Patellaria atrata CBS 101060 TaxID=1346257 RepID=A0A9P4VVK2_9PEZI|nr:hypothetical protein M501DRAFT_1014532 [Patellaria atrata CBS 101060]
MMAASSYFIYINHPSPVPSSTFTQCYPPQFLSSYFSQKSIVTPLPAIAPLICPAGYQTIFSSFFPDGYLACCPNGMGLATSVNAPFTRPALNGTCYSDVETIRVTAYGISSVTVTSTWSAPPGAQVYALAIEGYAFSVPATAINPSKPSPGGLAPTSTSALDEPTNRSSNNHTAALVGGVVGGVAGLTLITAILGYLLRRPQSRLPHPASEAPKSVIHQMPSPLSGIVGRAEMESTGKISHIGLARPPAVPPHPVELSADVEHRLENHARRLPGDGEPGNEARTCHIFTAYFVASSAYILVPRHDLNSKIL